MILSRYDLMVFYRAQYHKFMILELPFGDGEVG
jgi:hypothetical protein